MCVTLLCGALFAIPFYPRTANAAAYTTIGELTMNGDGSYRSGKVFNYDNLEKVYDAITGKTGADYDDVYNAINASDKKYVGPSDWVHNSPFATKDIVKGINSYDIRSRAGTQYKIMLGGLEWELEIGRASCRERV